MTVLFVENINPYREPASGIGTYLRYLTGFLNKNNIATALMGTGRDNGEEKKIPVQEFMAVKKNKTSHPHFIATLMAKIHRFKLPHDTLIHGQRPDVLLPFLLFKKNKTICTLHGIHSRSVYLKKGNIQGKIYEIIEGFVFRRVNALMAVSREVSENVVNKYPFCKDKIVTIPNEANKTIFFPRDKAKCKQSLGLQKNTRIILYVGRLEKEKHLSLLIDAFAGVKKSMRNCQLLLAGNGRQEKELKQYVRKSGLTNVTFWGPAAHKEISLMLNCADVLALSSFFEGSPIIIKEALACHVPVVSTDVGDVRETIKNREDCFIADAEPVDYAGKLMNAINHKHKYSQNEQGATPQIGLETILNVYNQFK